MRVTVTHAAGRHHGTWASAVPAVAAALREGHTATVTNSESPTRWALTLESGEVTATVLNPDLFAPDPPTPEWVERIAASAAPLIN